MKKLLSLLLVICLAIGLLPVIALADDPAPAKIYIMSTIELSVIEGGEPAYLKNKEFDAFNKPDGSSTFKAWTQEEATKDDWNVKFEWPKGGIPTVTLKDAKFDFYDNETQTYAYIKQADGTFVSTDNRNTQDLEQGGETENNPMISAISPVPDCHIDLKVVMEGESFVETGSGFVFGHLEQKENLAEAATGALDNRYFKNLTFTSVEKGKVVANGGGIGIMAKPGYNITFDNAYIEISTEVGGSNAIPIHATEGNITINGGHIKATNLKNCAIWTTGSSGDITINGDVTVENKLSSTAGASGIYAKGGTLTVNGGNIIGTGHNCPVLNAGKATIINGGNVNITSGYYGIYAGPESLVQIDGGTVEIVAEHASNFPIFLDSKMSGVAGANRENCEAYGEKLYTKPFLLLSDTPEKLPEVTATEAPTTEPTKPVTQPTQPSKPATQPTAATQSAQPSQGANQNNSTESGNDTILLIAAAALVLVAGAVVVVIVVKRKKA